MTIEQIQHLLAYLGYYRGGVDGIWGKNSKEACVAFQSDFGLDADGIPGKDTQKALRHAVAFGMETEDNPTTDWPSDCPNFTPAEFACQCGCGFDGVDHELVRICQRLRDRFGAPFQISSGCRCPANNKTVGGVANSKHQHGRAVDFCIRGKSAAQVLPVAQSMPGIRYAYAIDGNYVHMEMA